MNNNDELNNFLRHCNADGLMTSTIEFYGYAMRGLFKFSEARGVKKIEDITEDVMRDYFEVIRTKYAVPTICGRWLAFSVFFGWLQKSGYILSNPLDSVRKPKKNRRVIYSFNHSEINEIMTFYDKSTFIGFRNYTIMAVFLGTGIRKAELLGLQPESILLEQILGITVYRDPRKKQGHKLAHNSISLQIYCFCHHQQTQKRRVCHYSPSIYIYCE